MERVLFDDEHDVFRASFRRFVENEVVPIHQQWEQDGIVPHAMFEAAAAHGFLGMSVPTSHGGGGSDDFRFNVVIGEEAQRAGLAAFGLGMTLHNDICLPYFLAYCTDEQKDRWLPGLASGQLVSAIAMSEPGAGSDLASVQTTAVRSGDAYVVNGSKTFVTNGINADLIITAVKTNPSGRHDGITLLVLEKGMSGFSHGRNLEKLGLHAQDTAELFMHDVAVPVANRLGGEGEGFGNLMANLPQERLSIAVAAVAAARAALQSTAAYVTERHAFGVPLVSFQNTKFRLAEVATEIDVAQAFVDACVVARTAGELSATDAAKAKWWATEMQGRVVDACVQLHGGYGYMSEYAIARFYADARVTRIYGGTTEIMKEIIGRAILEQ